MLNKKFEILYFFIFFIKMNPPTYEYACQECQEQQEPEYYVICEESDPPCYPEYSDFTEGQRIRHTLHTTTCTTILKGTISNNKILYYGKLLSFNEFAKLHYSNIIGWKDCNADELKEYECEKDGKWISLRQFKGIY